MTTIALSAPKIPGPPGVPLLGWRGNMMKFFDFPSKYLRHLYQNYGDIAGITNDNTSIVFIFNPEYNRLLLSDADAFWTREEFIRIPQDSALKRVGAGLFSMNGEKHRLHRRLMMNAFDRSEISGYRQDIVRITEDVLNNWKPGTQIDVVREMQHLALRVVSKVLYGLDVTPYAKNLVDVIQEWMGLNLHPMVAVFPVNIPGLPYRRLLHLSEELEQRVLALIEEKRSRPSSEPDALTALIRAHDEDGNSLNDQDLVGHATLLFGVGHETTASNLIWTLFLLAQHPQVQADLLDELTNVLHGDVPTVAQFEKLPLLDAVVKESLRLLPPGAFSMREAQHPFEFRPYPPLPKGTFITFSQYVTHHRPDLYQDPDKFIPQRWETIKPNAYEYIPFGAGPRMCLGMGFAFMEVKVALSLILQRYRLALPEGVRLDCKETFALAPKKGLPMMVMPQDRQFNHVQVRGNIHDIIDLGYRV